MILAQVISEACLRDWWFQVQRTVHSQQDGLWLIQIIVISYGISARMNSIQTGNSGNLLCLFSSLPVLSIFFIGFILQFSKYGQSLWVLSDTFRGSKLFS